MYLLDSILKNVGGVYRQEFAINIIATFGHAFSLCSYDDRARLRKMIDTWTDYLGIPVFPVRLIEACRDVIRQSTQVRLIHTDSKSKSGGPMSNPINVLVMNQLQSLIRQKQIHLSSNRHDFGAQSQLQTLNEVNIL
jgi:hypothetical protein